MNTFWLGRGVNTFWLGVPYGTVEERPSGGYEEHVYIPGTLSEQRRLKRLEEEYRELLQAKEEAEQIIEAKQEKAQELKKDVKSEIEPSLDEELAYLLRQQVLTELLIEIAEQQAILTALNDEEDNLIIMMMLLD